MAEVKLLSLQKDYAPDHPSMLNAKRMADYALKQVTTRVEGVMTGLSNHLSAARATVDRLSNSLQTARSTDIKQAEDGRPYYEAKRRLEEIQKFQTLLSYKMLSEKIDVALPRSMLVEIVDKAEPGTHPVRPKKALNIVLGIVIVWWSAWDLRFSLNTSTPA